MQSNSFTCSVRAITLIAAVVLARAAIADWPMARGGPALLGVAAGRLPDQPVLLWTYSTGGPVKSSPAIVNGRVFIGSNDTNVHAIELSSGKRLWTAPTGDSVESSPLVLNGLVYVGSSDGFLYAFNATNGQRVWRYQTEDKILGSPNWFVNAGRTNVIVGSYDYKLHCLDAVTGRSNWVYESGNYINGSPAVAEGQTVFGGCDALLHVISLADGHIVQERRNERRAAAADLHW